MGTEVLRSQDCLRDRFPTQTLTFPSMKYRRNPNPSPTPSGRRKGSPARCQEKERGKERCRTNIVKFPAKNLMMGQVTILKRGEGLKPMKDRRSEIVADDEEKKTEMRKDEDTVLCSTDRLGPEPDLVPKQIRLTDLKSVDGVYAGSVCFTSPPPSSLPFPAFFAKKDLTKNDVATTDLRRLLRLDLP
ncbi:hypothetical protein HHK36_013859 [Tetracentron sinense]|uniref:Uncharacterized protein n=1 Tax=Tetracentron sinense TaxID=13715 RepID=A0A834Z723_TETSI|nr:hypothetical protein HHK36_013859 [Tetracentron sinense]